MANINLYGGMVLENYEKEETSISWGAYKLFREWAYTGKQAMGVKLMRECGLEKAMAHVDLAYAAMVEYKAACMGEDAKARGKACKTAYARVSEALYNLGVIDRPKGNVLASSEWAMFDNALSYKAGKQGLTWTTPGVFKKAILTALYKKAVGEELFDLSNNESFATRANERLVAACHREGNALPVIL